MTIIERLAKILLGKDNNPPLFRAIERGNVAKVRTLLDEGADAAMQNAAGSSALTVAVMHGRVEVARLLIERGADLEREGHDRLDAAVNKRNLAMVELLLDAGVDVNAASGWELLTALHIAASGGHTEMVDLLLARGADPEARDRRMETPLMKASKRGHATCVALLSSTPE